jgi:hypothetical protein
MKFIKVGAYIINHGNSFVKLVQPGDGSQDGWRTPITKWSVKPTSENENNTFLSLKDVKT